MVLSTSTNATTDTHVHMNTSLDINASLSVINTGSILLYIYIYRDCQFLHYNITLLTVYEGCSSHTGTPRAGASCCFRRQPQASSGPA